MYDARSIESYYKEELMEGRTRCVKETFFYVTILLSQTHVHNHNTEQSLNIIHTPSYHLNVKKSIVKYIFFMRLSNTQTFYNGVETCFHIYF